MRFLLKTLFVPGTLGFLALVLTVSVAALFWRRARRWSAIAIAVVFVSYAILAMPLVADAIAAPLLGTPHSDRSRLTHQDGTAVVMLTGDSSSGRLSETLDLIRRIDPAYVILSGSDQASEIDLRAAVPPARLIVLAKSRTTREQALDLQPVLAAHAIRRVCVVASGLQTRRALATFAALHLAVIPIPSPIDYVVRRSGAWRLVPQFGALQLSGDAIYEYGALIYYRWNRWVPAASPQASRTAQDGGTDLA